MILDNPSALDALMTTARKLERTIKANTVTPGLRRTRMAEARKLAKQMRQDLRALGLEGG